MRDKIKINKLTIIDHEPQFEYNANRCTGKSTGIALHTIGFALKNPGKQTGYINSGSSTHERDMVNYYINKLGLKYITTHKDHIIYEPFTYI